MRGICGHSGTSTPDHDHQQTHGKTTRQLAIHELFRANAGEKGFEKLVGTLLDRSLQHPASRQHQAHHQDIRQGQWYDGAHQQGFARAATRRRGADCDGGDRVLNGSRFRPGNPARSEQARAQIARQCFLQSSNEHRTWLIGGKEAYLGIFRIALADQDDHFGRIVGIAIEQRLRRLAKFLPTKILQFGRGWQESISGIFILEFGHALWLDRSDLLQRIRDTASSPECCYIGIRVPPVILGPHSLRIGPFQVVALDVARKAAQRVSVVIGCKTGLDGGCRLSSRSVDQHYAARLVVIESAGENRAQSQRDWQDQQSEPEALHRKDLANFASGDEQHVVHHCPTPSSPTMWTKISCRLARRSSQRRNAMPDEEQCSSTLSEETPGASSTRYSCQPSAPSPMADTD